METPEEAIQRHERWLAEHEAMIRKFDDGMVEIQALHRLTQANIQTVTTLLHLTIEEGARRMNRLDDKLVFCPTQLFTIPRRKNPLTPGPLPQGGEGGMDLRRVRGTEFGHGGTHWKSSSPRPLGGEGPGVRGSKISCDRTLVRNDPAAPDD